MAEEAKEEEVEYESDPEETKLSLKMRRREASDDEEEEEEEHGDGEDIGGRRENRRRIVDSDVESDGQGAAAEYEEDEEEDYVEEEEEDEEIIDEEEYVEELQRGIGEIEAVETVDETQAKGQGLAGSPEDRVGPKSVDGHFGEGANVNQEGQEAEVEDGEKKENEPYAVPTAGAFYMHDDRFRDNAGGRNRYMGLFHLSLAELS